jgi:phosphoglycolate phosphatase-like HAD superfamily hydrolase
MPFLPGTHIEIIHRSFGNAQGNKGTAVKRDDARPSKPIRFALFDFDGTISLIRTGWQGVMIPMMVDILLEVTDDERRGHRSGDLAQRGGQGPRSGDLAQREAQRGGQGRRSGDLAQQEKLGRRSGDLAQREKLARIVTDFVTRLTGKQTIYQMIQLAEEVKKRGGMPLDPLDYKKEYLRRLWSHIEDRVADLKAGRRRPDDLMLAGARDILEAFRVRDIQCYLASGTDRPYVLDEAAALGLTPYFGPHIYGALDDYENFSKRMVIRQILEENTLAGPELIAFGDGFVEIEDTKAAGGIAIGVASDEAAYQATDDADLPKYPVDAWKRERLIQAGADIIIPNFLEYGALMKYLGIWGEAK